MFEVIDDYNVIFLVYGIITQGDDTFFLVWNDDREWHYINSNICKPHVSLK